MTRRPSVGARRMLRCAVYTRKSTEEGLEQAFNSLHAQREACEAFISSQRHEGWTVLPQHYDDGGFSGGTMDRPALHQLLADIRAGKVDIIVCYKVDRLTRSLADFAKIVEIFDEKGVSFVSVTQQFNTTTSMGRLTLNVLLSFAQFEREVTGERIREKTAPTKREGMWLGGVPPLGYEVRDRKLVPVEREAEIVRHIFRRYAALESVRVLTEELAAQGVTGKQWTSGSGRRWGGQPLGRGALYRMLQNRIYRGEIVHKGEHYPGEHPPILDPELWDNVQARLAANTVEHSTGVRVKEPSLLAGLLFDGDGHRLSPTHAIKSGRRYRYYVSHPLVCGRRTKNPSGLRIAAGEIEQMVAEQLCQWLRDGPRVLAAIASDTSRLGEQEQLIREARLVAANWSELTQARKRAILVALIQRIDLRHDRIQIQLRTSRVARTLGGSAAPEPEPLPDGGEDPAPLVLSATGRLQRVGMGMKMLIDGAAAAKPDPRLIKLIVRAQALRTQLEQGGGRNVSEIAHAQKMDGSYFSRVVRLAYLAPDIIGAILEGRQPANLTAAKIIETSQLPMTWRDQRLYLGFDSR